MQEKNMQMNVRIHYIEISIINMLMLDIYAKKYRELPTRF